MATLQPQGSSDEQVVFCGAETFAFVVTGSILTKVGSVPSDEWEIKLCSYLVHAMLPV